jgi:hypothetical protein
MPHTPVSYDPVLQVGDISQTQMTMLEKLTFMKQLLHPSSRAKSTDDWQPVQAFSKH